MRVYGVSSGVIMVKRETDEDELAESKHVWLVNFGPSTGWIIFAGDEVEIQGESIELALRCFSGWVATDYFAEFVSDPARSFEEWVVFAFPDSLNGHAMSTLRDPVVNAFTLNPAKTSGGTVVDTVMGFVRVKKEYALECCKCSHVRRIVVNTSRGMRDQDLGLAATLVPSSFYSGGDTSKDIETIGEELWSGLKERFYGLVPFGKKWERIGMRYIAENHDVVIEQLSTFFVVQNPQTVVTKKYVLSFVPKEISQNQIIGLLKDQLKWHVVVLDEMNRSRFSSQDTTAYVVGAACKPQRHMLRIKGGRTIGIQAQQQQGKRGGQDAVWTKDLGGDLWRS